MAVRLSPTPGRIAVPILCTPARSRPREALTTIVPNPFAPIDRLDFDFDLPPGLIAQTPLQDRDASRLLTLDRETGRLGHDRFSSLPDLLREGDLLVVNRSRVVPARLLGRTPPLPASSTIPIPSCPKVRPTSTVATSPFRI